MRKFKFAAMLLAVLSTAACVNNDVVNPQSTPQAKKPKLVVLVYDISASVDGYAVLREDHLKNLYDAISFGGGGVFVSIKILCKSKQQEVVAEKILACDTLECKGNVYQRNWIVKKNAEIKKASEQKRQTFLNRLTPILLVDKSERQSDVKNALDMAKTTVDNPIYDGYEKIVLIISDLKETAKKADYSVDFGTVYTVLIRAEEDQVGRVKSKTLLRTNTIDEGIEFIKKINNH